MNPSGDDKKYGPSTDPTPERDNPNDPKKQEKELEEEKEKDPGEKFKEEEKGGFGEWCKNHPVKAIKWLLCAVYILQAIYRTIDFEIKQRKQRAAGIFFQYGPKEKCNIKPIVGLWKSFTNPRLFRKNEELKAKEYTRDYIGIWRILMNAIAAFTAAKYNWEVGYLYK